MLECLGVFIAPASRRRDSATIAPVSVGTVRESFGSNLPDFDNYYCRDCGRIIHVRKGSPGFRQCPTPECSRPTGFGAYATTPRPRKGGADGPAHPNGLKA